jgi:hypothetical protein
MLLLNVAHPVLTAFAWSYNEAFAGCYARVSPARADFLDVHYPTIVLQARCGCDAIKGQIGFSAEIDVVWRYSHWDLAGLVSTSAGNWPLDLSWWTESSTPRDDFARVLLMAWRRYEYAVRGVAVPHALFAP